MSEEQIRDLKQQAKDYAWAIFNQSEKDRLNNFEHFVNVLWLYVDQQIKNHCKDKHDE
jgi:hypothetical protein